MVLLSSVIFLSMNETVHGVAFNESVTSVDFDANKERSELFRKVNNLLVSLGVVNEDVEKGKIRPGTILYMVYWYNRLAKNREEQEKVRDAAIAYLGTVSDDAVSMAKRILLGGTLHEESKRFAEALQFPEQTVDLVVVRGENGGTEIATIHRDNYPVGNALPGGFILDTDEDNELEVPAPLFAALRVAGGKILKLSNTQQKYHKGRDESGRSFVIVHGDTKEPAVKIYAEDDSGYIYRENPKSMLRPSDPRHLVNTRAFRCELVGELGDGLAWQKKSRIMTPKSSQVGLCFHTTANLSHIYLRRHR